MGDCLCYMTQIRISRVYADAGGTPDDGYRVFVDRLWPRGESKSKFHYDLWAKDISPSAELREWYHADPEGRWPEFERRYLAELDSSEAAAGLVRELSSHKVVTLLYGSKDTAHNNAVVLAGFLAKHLKDNDKE